MDGSGEYIVERCHSMKVGERMRVTRHVMNDAFGIGGFEGMPFADPYANNPRERLLNRLMGSSYGAFVVEQDVLTGDYTVSRNEPGDRRVYAEADRRHILPPEVQKAIEDGRHA